MLSMHSSHFHLDNQTARTLLYLSLPFVKHTMLKYTVIRTLQIRLLKNNNQDKQVV